MLLDFPLRLLELHSHVSVALDSSACLERPLQILLSEVSLQPKAKFARHLKAIGSRLYKRNLGNTALTVLLSIAFTTVLYCLVWFPELNKAKLSVSTDTLVSVPRNSVEGID